MRFVFSVVINVARGGLVQRAGKGVRGLSVSRQNGGGRGRSTSPGVVADSAAQGTSDLWSPFGGPFSTLLVPGSGLHSFGSEQRGISEEVHCWGCDWVRAFKAFVFAFCSTCLSDHCRLPELASVPPAAMAPPTTTPKTITPPTFSNASGGGLVVGWGGGGGLLLSRVVELVPPSS
jgi:hypothetical protein